MEKLTLLECSKKKIEETFVVMYAIRNEINIKKGDLIELGIIYTFIGVDKKGFRHFINIYLDRPLNNRYWLDCFETMKIRGLKNLLFLSVDDNKNLKRTAKIAFPDVIFVDSLTDIVPKFYKYTPERNNKILASKLHYLYTQKTNEDYKKYFNEFKLNYNNVIHQKLIEKYLNNIENTYKFSLNVRTLIFKYAANMEIYDRIRLIFNQRNSYITEISEIFEKLERIDNYFGFTSFKKKEWTLILNDLIQIYPKIDFI